MTVAAGYFVYGRAPDGRRWFLTSDVALAEIEVRISARRGLVAKLLPMLARDDGRARSLHLTTDRGRAEACADRQAAASLASALNGLDIGFAWAASEGLPY